MTDLLRLGSRMFVVVGACTSLALLAVAADSGRPALTARFPIASAGQSATLLPDGRWLLLGGRTDSEAASSQAVLLDQSLGQRQVLPRGLAVPRAGHTATVIPDGTVLIIGGTDRSGQPVSSLERFHPDTQQFEDLGDVGLEARTGQTATLLTNGQVLLVGGADVSTLVHSDAQILDPVTLRVSDAAAQLSEARSGQSALLLPSGDVLISGGTDHRGDTLSSAELYRVSSRQFETIAPAAAATLLSQNASATAPAIVAALPQSETQVAVDARFALRFSKPLLPGSLSDQTITLLGPAEPVEASVVAAEGGLLAFVRPRQTLLPGSHYTLFVKGAQDTGGQALPFAALAFQTETLAPSRLVSSAARLDLLKPRPDLSLDDRDGEMWVPDKHNLTGVWRSGRAGEARRHLPRRRSLARALYGKASGSGLPEAPAGVTAITGQVLRLNGAPLAKVTLSVGSRAVLTDSNGEFLLTEVPAGTQKLVIDGSTADKGPVHYGRYEYRAIIEPRKTNALPFVIWMTRLDSRNAVQIPSPTSAETVVTNPHIPGLELHIPANTVIRDSAGNNVTQITITAIPVDQPPFPLPNHQVPVYFTIQPGGAHLQGLTMQAARGARLIYPNFTNASPGERIDFWNYDPREKGWYVYGQGTASDDRLQIVPDPGVVIYEFTGAMVALPSTAPAEGPPPGGCESGSANAAEKAGDPVDCFTGLFVHDRTDLAVNDVLPLEVRRTYRPRDNTSRAFGIGTNLSYDFFLVGDMNPYTYQDLILPDGGRVHYTRISSGTSWTDAVYTTTTSPGKYFGSVIRWNTATNSGWLLTLADGTVYTFPEAAGQAVARCGAVIGIRDRYGNAIAFTRDPYCNLTSVTSPNGRKITFTYDTSNRITQASDPMGRTVTYHYDASGRLDLVTDPAGKTESYAYDSSNRMLTVTDKRGNVMVTNTYDANGRVSQQTYADNTTASFSYVLDANSHVTQMDFTNERGVVKRVQFNAAGLPTSITYALGKPEQQTITIARDPATNLAQTVTDALGRVASYQYDSNGNVTQVTRLFGTGNANTWSFTYEPTFQQLASATDPNGHATTYSYDVLGNLTTVTDPLGHVTSMEHNPAGQVTSSTRSDGSNPLTNSATYGGGILASVTDPLNRTTQFFVDPIGRITAVKNALGNITRREYDAVGRITQTVDPLGNTIHYGYDDNGNLLTFQDARNNVWSFVYDARNRLTSSTDPLNHVVTYVYDAIGNRIQVTDRKGQVSGYTYDFLDRLTNAGFGATASNPTAYSSTIAYTWDAGNRMTQAVDSSSGTIARTFDDLDRLTQEQSPQGQVNYTYYANSLRQTMTVQGQTAVTYSYDNADRLTQIAQGSAAVGFSYDAVDRRTNLTLPNGVQVSYSYDAAGELTGVSYQNGTTALGNLTYSYDAGGLRTGMGGSLAQVNLPAAVGAAAYDAANRLTTWGADTLTYDDNGNLVSQGSSTYGWNARDELISASDGGGAFAYDAVGRRISRTVSSATTSYLHDGLNPVLANGDFLLSGLGLDEIYARINATATTSYLSDALGSTLALTDATGATTASFAYQPYGASSKTGTDDTSFRFTGREDDGATQLQYFRARYYSSRLGRFISSDPIGLGGGANSYAYADGDPVGATDPLGLITSVDFACMRDPQFCAEVMGQIVRNAGAASGNPCLEQAANEIANGFQAAGNIAVAATIVGGVTKAAARGVTGAQNTANASKLAKQLGSEEGVVELLSGGGKAIAGAGTKVPLRDVGRLVREYGGRPGDWAKITSTAEGHLQTHAYRNVVTGEVVELKSIVP